MTAIPISIHRDVSNSFTICERAETDTTPFCQRKWKNVYFINKVALHLIFAIANYIAQFICCLSKRWSHHFAQKAKFHWMNFGNNLDTYLLYGNRVLDFSVNMSPRPLELLSPGQTEKGAFLEVFGPRSLNALPLNIERTDEIIDREKVRLASDGICLGESLDFIYRYLSELKNGKTPMAAVQTIAHRYADGAPDSAWYMQSLSQAAKVDYRIGVEAIANAIGLRVIGNRNLYGGECIPEHRELGKRISQLPDAVYEVTLRPVTGGEAHSVVLIKAGSDFFTHDSNRGTLLFNRAEAVKALWESSKEYCPGAKSEFSFTAYQLSDSR